MTYYSFLLHFSVKIQNVIKAAFKVEENSENTQNYRRPGKGRQCYVEFSLLQATNTNFYGTFKMSLV